MGRELLPDFLRVFFFKVFFLLVFFCSVAFFQGCARDAMSPVSRRGRGCECLRSVTAMSQGHADGRRSSPRSGAASAGNRAV